MDDFTKELEQDFLEEAFSLIDNLESSLLQLENNPGDTKSINEVFRVAHTIKGGAGTVGFDEIQEFTHLIEDILDMVRKNKLALTSEIITILLECRDIIDKMLSARSSGGTYEDPRAYQIIDILSKIKFSSIEAQKPDTKPMPSAAPPASVQTSGENNLNLSNQELNTINDALSKGRNVYLMKYILNETYDMKEVSSFQLYSLLKDTSEIIKIIPSLEELETMFHNEVIFIISSEMDENYLKGKTFLQEMVVQINSIMIDSKKLSELETSRAAQDNNVDIKNQISANESASDETKSVEQVQQEPDQKEDTAVEKRNLSTLRVESWKVDNLLNLLGELVITKSTFTQLDNDFDRISTDLKTTLKEFLNGIMKLNLTGEPELVAEKNKTLLNALSMIFSSFDTFSENIQKINRISSSLQENVMNMRMVPIQTVFTRFPRLIRDIASKLDKKIDLIIEGVETEIDKGMVDDIFDPLIHLLRNAVDHGIESPAVRKAANKPEIGKIILKATHEGDSIVIEVSDDGKGIDPEALRVKALASNTMDRNLLQKMSHRELLGLIFLPGFSTAKEVSNLSGRGVGMDIVRKKIEEIGGSVGISTVKGKGTKFIIRLPLTLAIIQGLLIVVEGMYYVIPVASVEETVIIDPKNLKDINGTFALELRDKLIPILALKNFFYGLPFNIEENTKEYCIVTKYGERQVGIIVSEVVGEQDIVIKPLNTKLIKSPGISAATIVGNGDIGYIIDTSQIISYFFKVGIKTQQEG
jgi:two-component system chemotaxis sensor kinase CheA